MTKPTTSPPRAKAGATAAPATPLIRLFKVGQFVSAEGTRMSFSAEDLKATAAAYNAENDPAPMVIGHPQMNDQAYGWIKSLRFEGDELLAEPGDIEPAFAEQVRAGRYAKVSAQFYKRGHPSSPSPDVHALRHVGFFGAHPVAVKGMGRVSFSEADDRDLAIVNTLQEDQPVTDPVTKTVPIADPIVEPVVADPNTVPTDDPQRQTDLEAREAAIAEREKVAADREAEEARAGHKSFAEGLVEAGKLKPAYLDRVVGLLDGPDAGGTFSFGEGVEATDQAEVLREILTDGRPEMSFGEQAAPDAAADANLISFAMPAGHTASNEQVQRMTKVSQLMTADAKLTLIEATRQVDAAG